jgi:hypothetical protein
VLTLIKITVLEGMDFLLDINMSPKDFTNAWKIFVDYCAYEDRTFKKEIPIIVKMDERDRPILVSMLIDIPDNIDRTREETLDMLVKNLERKGLKVIVRKE